MRLRNVPGAREVMIENEYVFTEPEGMKGTWSQVFGNDNPIRIETVSYTHLDVYKRQVYM